jgi:hypothetical protein
MDNKLFANYNFLGEQEDPSQEDQEAEVEQDSVASESVMDFGKQDQR